jgi:PIN domain nuclease of toxin-antitoxin system
MSEVIVLDTHIWFWWITQEFQRFPSHWRDIFERGEQVAVSVISCYEIALAQQRGRLILPCSPREWFQEALTPSGILMFNLTPEITTRATELTMIHKDPFDRLIIATALEYRAQLASVDSLFPQYPELSNSLMKLTDTKEREEA